MTCKDDCLYYKVCSDFIGNICDTDLNRFMEYRGTSDGLCGWFKNKADFVEVVRCGKCKHWERFSKNPSLGNCSNEENGLFEFTNPEDFCSYGEKRE